MLPLSHLQFEEMLNGIIRMNSREHSAFEAEYKMLIAEIRNWRSAFYNPNEASSLPVGRPMH